MSAERFLVACTQMGGSPLAAAPVTMMRTTSIHGKMGLWQTSNRPKMGRGLPGWL